MEAILVALGLIEFAPGLLAFIGFCVILYWSFILFWFILMQLSKAVVFLLKKLWKFLSLVLTPLAFLVYEINKYALSKKVS